MIEKKYQKTIDAFVNKVLENYRDKIESITLFGSVAREEVKDDSDIDLLIVTNTEDFRLRRAVIGMAFDFLLDTGHNVSVKVLSKDDFERHKNFSFLRKVTSEGVKVV